MNNQIPVELYKDGWTMQGTYKYLLGPLWVFVNLFKLCLSLSLSPLFLRFVVNFDWELPGEATAGARGALEKRRRGGAAEWMDSQESLSVQVMGNGL